MTVRKGFAAVAIALAFIPAVAQAASAPAIPAAQSLSIAPAGTLAMPGRIGGKSGKRSHVFGLGVLASLLIAAGAVAAAVVIADAVDSSNSG
jgi:hypothetical protein